MNEDGMSHYMYGLNCYLPVSLLEIALGQANKNELFKFKVKLRKGGDPKQTEDLYSFEISVFNILSIAKNPKIFLKGVDEVV